MKHGWEFMGNLVDIKRCVKEEKCLVRSDQNVALVYNFRKLFNKQKMHELGVLSWSSTKFSQLICKEIYSNLKAELGLRSQIPGLC